MLGFETSLYILNTSHLSDACFANLLSQDVSVLSFPFSNTVFFRADVLNFNEIHISFSYSPLLLHRSPTDMVVMWVREVFYNPMIMSQSFSEPVFLGHDLHNFFSIFPFPLRCDRKVREDGGDHFPSPTSTARWAGVGYITFPAQSGSRKTPVVEALVE